MLEVLQNQYFILFYGIALFYSIIKYKYYFDSILRYFPILIGYTLLTELLGLIIREFDSFQLVYIEGYSYYNQLIFNIFDIIFFLYFFFVFRKALHNSNTKRAIFISTFIYLLVAIINPFLQDILMFPQIWAIIIGSIILVFCCVNYLVEVKKAIQDNKRINLLFWICIGLLVFNIAYPIIMSIGVLNYELYEQLQLHIFLRALIATMYGFFIIGFVKTKKRVVL